MGYKLGAAFLWAVGQALAAKYSEQGMVAAAFGGLIAGWCTASLLGLVAKCGAGARGMMIAGVILGVLLASGAVVGLSHAVASVDPTAVKVNWDDLGKYFLSWSILASALLGLFTGLYVHGKTSGEKKK